MNKKSLTLLEYAKIIDLLAEEASSALGRDEIYKLTPMTHIRMIQDALTETTEAVSVILCKGSIPIGEFGDITTLLTLARKGRSLTMRELLLVRRSLAAVREVKNFLSEDVPEVPGILEIAGLLVPETRLEQDITRSILSEDEMADQASSELKRIRRDIRNKNEAIRHRLEKYAGSSSKYLQDAIVTMRNGRYVIPVKREYSNLVPGLVHDQSQSGATLFIEPQAIVMMNNELKELALAEQAEIARILQALTDRVAEHYHDLRNNQELLVRLDVIQAKGKLACSMNAFCPKLNTEGRISIRRGRHPLLPKDKAVPIDVSLGEDYSTLLITGPNTGGKTVTLKTIGLLILMAQTGLHVPCNEESELPVLKDVYADIGDEQSIEQSLSTFSSHMVNISEILREAGPETLVLLDELGAGTDPAEGAALAIAILEHLKAAGALVASTTHYTELKKYALETEGVENASMEFDVETLSPTYRLRVGLPGKSNAFEISRKLGIQPEIVDRAADLLSDSQLDFERAVTRVEEDQRRIDHRLQEVEALRKEAEDKLREAEKRIEDAEAERDKILRRAQEDADLVLLEAEEHVKEVSDSLKAAKTQDHGHSMAAVAESRRKLGKARKELKPEAPTPKRSHAVPTPDQLMPGTRIKLLSLGQNGEVETAPDAKGNLTVRIGALKMSARIDDLMIIENNPAGTKSRNRRAYQRISTEKARTISPEINVIGLTVDDAVERLSKYLDNAYLSGLDEVRIIHGKGTGALRSGIRDYLRQNRIVKSCTDAPYNAGGAGATVVKLKKDS